MSVHVLFEQHELGVLLSLKMWTRKEVMVKCFCIFGDVEYRVIQYTEELTVSTTGANHHLLCEGGDMANETWIHVRSCPIETT